MKSFFLTKTQILATLLVLFIVNVSFSQAVDHNSSKVAKKTRPIYDKKVNLETTYDEKPVDFPKYVNTGEVEKDIETYRKAKDEWIEKNPEKYAKMISPASKSKEDIDRENKERESKK
ncbi:MAG: hypothetical protein A2033_14820 [Bacteroidetes bacterium GWA2_31_9]|nr:MAG: hypothetical protein A2033_14820 [Bacteroidetes bacterium GWA2_31_9]